MLSQVRLVEVIPWFIHPPKKKKCEVACRGFSVRSHMYSDHRSLLSSLRPRPLRIWFRGGLVIHAHTVSRSSSGGILVYFLFGFGTLLSVPPLLLLHSAILCFPLLPCSFGLSSFSSVLPFDQIFGHKGGRQVGVGVGRRGGVHEGRVWGSIGVASPPSFVPFWLGFHWLRVPGFPLSHRRGGSSGHSSPR